MIAAVLRARTRPDLVDAVRALDRVLDLRLLCRAAVLSARAMGGALVVYQASGAHRRCSATCRKPGGGKAARFCDDTAMILGDFTRAAGAPAPGYGRITLDDLFRRAAARRPGAIALADPPNRQAFTDGAAAAPVLCRGRPHGLGDCRAAAPDRAADRCHRRHPDAEYRRARPDASWRVARRIDRGAAAAVVAARRCRDRAGAGRRQRR